MPLNTGAGGTTLGINHAVLSAAFNTAGCTKAGDWTEWSRRVGVELLRQSPSILLRPCASLAQVCVCYHLVLASRACRNTHMRTVSVVAILSATCRLGVALVF